MIVGKAIYYLLTNATGVTDIVSTRVYPEVAQQDAALPYIVYNVTNNEPTDTKPEPSKLDTAQVEVNIYSDSYTEAIDLAVAVRAALDRVKGTYNGVNVQSIQYLNEIIDFDEPQRAYNITADYDVRISRSGFEIAQGSPITGVELGELSDVNVTGVTDNQILSYDAATDTWVPAADAGGAENIDDLDDVNAGSPNNNDVLKFNSSTSKWTPVDWLSVLYAQFKQGTDATITNGSLSDSSLELTSTQAKLKAGITGLDITETSPGTIEIIVATDATGSTEFTALTLEGLSTSEKARFTVNNGTSFYIRGTSAYHNQLRGNSGITSSKVNMLPASDGLLALDADIPSTTDDLTEGSTNIYYTEARVSANTDVAANTAKVGVIAGGTTGQALVKSTGTDYDVEWADIAIDVQYHQRYDTEAAALRSGATETVELYYTAQADGDGYAESASSDTATAGYDIRRKLYYSEAAQADPDTGTWVQFADIADDTTFASAKAILLAYLKERTGGTVPISLKMTWEEVAESSLLLDTYTGAAAAYSLRQLAATATNAIRVRRASDNAEQDIGFDGSGGLDTTSLALFCLGTDGFVKVWYDQSGNANDATQATTANQPKIYDSVTGVVTENGKPAVEFDGSNDVLSISTITAATNFGMYFLSKSLTTSSNRKFFIDESQNSFNLLINKDEFRYSDGTTVHTLKSADTAQNLYAINKGTSTSEAYINGTDLSISTIGDGDLTTLSFGGRTTIAQYSNARTQEFIVYDSDQSTNRANIEDNINTFYSIY
jgi:hypothetical protein